MYSVHGQCLVYSLHFKFNILQFTVHSLGKGSKIKGGKCDHCQLGEICEGFFVFVSVTFGKQLKIF